MTERKDSSRHLGKFQASQNVVHKALKGFITMRHKYLLLLMLSIVLISGFKPGFAADDIAEIPSKTITLDDDRKLQMILIGNPDQETAPKNGFRLIIVMPGGDGSKDFEPFIKRIYKNSLDTKNDLVCQLVAPKWNENQQIVWPTSKHPVEGMKTTLEDFLKQAVVKVQSLSKIDLKKIYTLSWSSSGPAAYAISLTDKTPVTGSFIAMSVFQKNRIPDIKAAKDRAYYILHSPDDKVCPVWMARMARNSLRFNKAKVEYLEYKGGHGWRGDVFGTIKTGFNSLDDQITK